MRDSKPRWLRDPFPDTLFSVVEDRRCPWDAREPLVARVPKRRIEHHAKSSKRGMRIRAGRGSRPRGREMDNARPTAPTSASSGSFGYGARPDSFRTLRCLFHTAKKFALAVDGERQLVRPQHAPRLELGDGRGELACAALLSQTVCGLLHTKGVRCYC